MTSPAMNRTDRDRIMMALMQGDLPTLERWRAEGASINDDIAYRVTPLIWAVSRGAPAAVVWLLQHGARHDLDDPQGLSPMDLALARPDGIDIARALLAAGVDLGRPNGLGRTPLVQAVLDTKDDSEKNLLALLDESTADWHLDALSPEGNSAVMMAIGLQKWNLLGALLQAGASPDQPDAKGRTVVDALIESSQPQHPEKEPSPRDLDPKVMLALMENMIQSLPGFDPNARHGWGSSMDRALQTRSPPVLDLLIRHGGDANHITRTFAARGIGVAAAMATSMECRWLAQPSVRTWCEKHPETCAWDRENPDGDIPSPVSGSPANPPPPRAIAVVRAIQAVVTNRSLLRKTLPLLSAEALRARDDESRANALAWAMQTRNWGIVPDLLAAAPDLAVDPAETDPLLSAPLALAHQEKAALADLDSDRPLPPSKAWVGPMWRLLLMRALPPLTSARAAALPSLVWTLTQSPARLRDLIAAGVAIPPAPVRAGTTTIPTLLGAILATPHPTSAAPAMTTESIDALLEAIHLALESGASPWDATGIEKQDIHLTGWDALAEADPPPSVWQALLVHPTASQRRRDDGGKTMIHSLLLAGRLDRAEALLRRPLSDDPRKPLEVGRDWLLDLVDAQALLAKNLAAQQAVVGALGLLTLDPSVLECRDEDGNTPLLRAVGTGQEHLAQVLLLRGADPGAVNKAGETALHHAVAQDLRTAAAWLWGLGAQDAPTKEGLTPSRIAKDQDNAALIDLLRSNPTTHRPPRTTDESARDNQAHRERVAAAATFWAAVDAPSPQSAPRRSGLSP